MPKMKCSTEGCKTDGGIFHHVGPWDERGRYVCHNCYVSPPDRRVSTCISTFPFTTKMLTGTPVEVKSLRHLRQLENRHGVQSDAYN